MLALRALAGEPNPWRRDPNTNLTSCRGQGVDFAPATKPERANPHDALFKAVFSERENALALFRSTLPEGLAKAIDARSVRAEPGGFTDDELREVERDLVFSARLRGGGRVLVYLLVEHQSTVDPLMPLRLLRYVVRVWERWQRENPDTHPIPAIYPLVLHQGPRRWSGPRRLADLLDLPDDLLGEIGRNLPALEVALLDLGDLSRDALAAMRTVAYVRLTLLLLWASRQGGKALEEAWLHFLELVAEVRRGPRGEERVVVLFRYTRFVGGVDMKKLVKTLRRSAVPDAARLDELSRLVVAQSREEGREEGREEVRKALVRSLARQLRTCFGNLSATVSRRIENATVADLEQWSSRVLVATTLDQVFSRAPRSRPTE